MQLKLHNRVLDLDAPKIMGILNVTPDSFSDGGSYQNLDQALWRVETMLEEGAAIIDIGGESTRPGSAAPSEDEELDRVIPVCEAVCRRFDAAVSIDTSRPKVMEEAFRAGAHIWNDVRALQLEGAEETALKLKIPVILMHMQGTPSTMQDKPSYKDVVQEVLDFLQNRTAHLIDKGFESQHILWDVGFGFGKSTADNYRLLKHLDIFARRGFPLVAALSRKNMIGEVTGVKDPARRVTGSATAAALCAERGAVIVRVHDVKATQEALAVVRAVREQI